jgi:ABC-type branched-subunit amino acid transport system substrate-binding protein
VNGDGALRRLFDSVETKATGEFVCEAGGVEVHAFVQGGRIVWATDSQHPRAFARLLKQQAGVDDESLEEAFQEGRRLNTPFGETVVAWKLATPEQVRAALRDQIKPALYRLALCSNSAKAVFLPRSTQDARYSADLTFGIEEFLVTLKSVPQADAAKAAGGNGAHAAPGAPAPAPSPAAAPTLSPVPALDRKAEHERAPKLAPQHPPAAAGAKPVSARPAVTKAPPARPAPRAGSSHPLGAVVVLTLLGAGVAGLLYMRRGATNAAADKASAPSAATAAAAAARTGVVANAPELVFGMASPFSGAVKDIGHSMRTGVEAAFAVANEAGGIQGRKLRLLALDDGYDPSRTLGVMQELLESRKVFGIVGNFGTPTAAVAAPYAVDQKVLFFGAVSGSSLLRKVPPDRYVFNYRPSYAEETATAVRYLVNVRRIPPSQIAMFFEEGDFGRSGVGGVEDQLRKLGHDPAQMVKTTYARGSADVAGAVAHVVRERARIRAVVMVATYQAAIQFIQQVKDQVPGIVFTNVSTVGASALAEGLVGAGRGYTDDVVVTQIVPLPTSKATAAMEYQAALEKYASGEKPDFVTFEGYIVGKILIEGLRRAGKNLDTESVVGALEDIHGLDLGIGTMINFGPSDHQGSHKVWGTSLQPDGTYKTIKLE